jgi:hypothetical protein
MAHEDDIAAYARTHWWSGTDEIRLTKAARAFDCDLELFRTSNPDRARRKLIEILRHRTPVLLCVDDWGHWITVLRHQSKQFVVVDSNLDPVLNIITWSQLSRRWRYYDVDYDATDPPSLYDGFAVKPRFRVPMRADFSVDRVRYLRRQENHGLAVHWDEYLGDLMEVCRPRSSRMANALSMGEFLRRNQELISSRLEHWHGYVDRRDLDRLLQNFRFVAETYGLVIPSASARRALADISILATFWACASGGVGPIYGANED